MVVPVFILVTLTGMVIEESDHVKGCMRYIFVKRLCPKFYVIDGKTGFSGGRLCFNCFQ